MAEYIKRKKVYADISRLFIDGSILSDYEDGRNDATSEAMDIINNAPAEDVRPERHGQWILDDSDEYVNRYHCSECGAKIATCNEIYDEPPPNYCENCGAKMDGKGRSEDWIVTSEQLPPENQIVDTKIEDEKGVRNETPLIFCNNLWWLPDKSMYIYYYTPTHWRYRTQLSGKDGESDG